jgi:hypothetical protein
MHVARALALIALITGCAGPEGADAPARAPSDAAAPSTTAPARDAARRSEVAGHFADLEAQLLRTGLLRRDGGGADAPYGPRRLAETFVKIALYDEYAIGPEGFEARATPAMLRRWDGPLRIGMVFGASVDPAQRATDRATVASLSARLSDLSGLPVGLAERGQNLWVYVVSEEERRALAPEWSRRFDGVPPEVFAPVAGMGLETVCLALGFSPGANPVYRGGLVVVRAELPERLREACFHEEIAQAMGLVNDAPEARPSIFNDDEEFATLTPLDDHLVAMLYDPRLRPGMTEAEARPIVEQIAAERLGAGG